jgi:anti-sigma factor RsiW
MEKVPAAPVLAERALPGPESATRSSITEGRAITSDNHTPARRKAPRPKSSPSGAKPTPRRHGNKLISCKKETSFISAYIADQLTNAERLAFELHLDACPDCAAFLSTYRKTIELTRSFLRSSSPQSLPRKLVLQR